MALMEYKKSHDRFSSIPLFKLFTFGYSGQSPAEKFSEIERGHPHDPVRGCRGSESSRIAYKQKRYRSILCRVPCSHVQSYFGAPVGIQAAR
jgi:hypothetical protein